MTREEFIDSKTEDLQGCSCEPCREELRSQIGETWDEAAACERESIAVMVCALAEGHRKDADEGSKQDHYMLTYLLGVAAKIREGA